MMVFMHYFFMKQTNEVVYLLYMKRSCFGYTLHNVMKYIMRCTSVLMFSCYTNCYIYLHVFDVYDKKIVGKYTISLVNIDAMGVGSVKLSNFPPRSEPTFATSASSARLRQCLVQLRLWGRFIYHYLRRWVIKKHPNGGNGNGISGCHPLYVFVED